MTLDDDDFTLFGLRPRFAQERGQIDARWRELQARVHPDRFAVEGPAAKRVAMQWAVRVNEAYQRLKDPLKRAAYLCELRGVPIQAEVNTAMPAGFLQQQLEWREALDDARSIEDIEALGQLVDRHRQAALAQLQADLDERADLDRAAQEVRALMFVERFEQDIDQRMEALGQ